ncbi:MAG: DNA alkylation repair protein [Acidobacteria bacterium]|nr:DNA alkylation repair protein [Acidobacteriota bacterium]
MSPDPRVTVLVADLQERLDAASDPGTKAWFENYLKQVIEYRGVKTPVVARIVAEWRGEHGIGRLPDEDQLGVARCLIQESVAEEKFAGTLYMQKYLLRRLAPDRLLTVAEGLFAEGAFFDWSTSDWFSVRVLGPLLRQGGMGTAERIAGWRTAGNLWQRRAAIVPFRAVVGDASYHPLIAATIAALVGERERFVQTGIGWVVSDMAKSQPEVAAALVERHFEDLSAEVIRRHTRYLPDHEDYKERKRRPRERRSSDRHRRAKRGETL